VNPPSPRIVGGLVRRKLALTARDKSAVIAELLALFGASPDDTISEGYVNLA
jgi:hypothetical protein